MSNRILDYPEATEITSNDYILLDNEGTGAKCIKASALNINMDNYTIKEARGAIASFDDGEDLPLAFLGAYITAIQEGSGDPSPSNVRPISGWDEAEIIDDPVYGGYVDFNQLVQNGDFESTNNWVSYLSAYTISNNVATVTPSAKWGLIYNQINLDSSHLYYISADVWGKANNYVEINNGFGTKTHSSTEQWEKISFVKKPTNTASTTINIGTNSTDLSGFKVRNVICIDLTQAFGETKANEIYAMEQAQSGSGVAYVKSLLPNDYYAYNTGEITNISAVNGTPYGKYNITFTDGTNPLTVYGGYVDLVSGQLVVNRGHEIYDGSNDEDWRHYGGNRVTVAVDDFTSPASSVTANIMCDKLKTITKSQQGSLEYVISGSDEGYHQFMVNVGISDITELRTWLSNNPITVVYELAQPLTYSLTKQQIKSLVGVNNIFADTGDSVVDYRKLWVMPEM